MLGGVAVVTGGASGIGQALCYALVPLGVPHVVVADLRLDAARQVAADINRFYPSRPAVAFELDVAHTQSVARVVERIETEIGPIALYCSNAGVHVGQGLGETEDWQRSLAVNLVGHVNAARAVIPRMAARKGGHVVITASAAGLLTDLRSAPYAASKHAAVALAEWLSIAHDHDGVSISCVCPEGVRTGMTRPDSLKAGASSDFLEPEDVAREIINALRTKCFLVLPHPRVAEYERRRVVDRENWLGRMRMARRRLMQVAPAPAAS